MRFPDLLVGNVLHLFPGLGIREPLAPVRLQVLVVERGQVAAEPAQQVYAVGDGDDGDLPHRELRPQVLEHLLRDRPVQPAHRVAEAGRLDRQHGHREPLVAIRGIAPPQAHELLEIDAGFAAVFVEVLPHEPRVEDVDARRNRGVRGEDVVVPRRLQRLLEAQAPLLDQHPHPLQGQERRVPFVHVVHRRLQPQRLQRPQAADAQHNLLADAHVVVAAVQRIGNAAVLGPFVLGDVGIQQVQLHPPDFHQPDLDPHHPRGQLDLHLEFASPGIPRRSHRQSVKIVQRVALLLPSVRVQVLLQVAGLVKQAAAHHRDVRIAARLQKVSREHSQPAGVRGQALDDAVLHREVSRQPFLARSLQAVHVSVISLTRPAIQGQIARIASQFLEAGLRNPARIAPPAALLHRKTQPVERAVHAPEQAPDGRFPAPKDVVSELRHPRQRRRKGRSHQEFPKWLNLKRHGRVRSLTT